MEKVLMCAGVTLSQQLLPQLNLLQEELLNGFSVLQVWKLQHKKHSASKKQIRPLVSLRPHRKSQCHKQKHALKHIQGIYGNLLCKPHDVNRIIKRLTKPECNS